MVEGYDQSSSSNLLPLFLFLLYQHDTKSLFTVNISPEPRSDEIVHKAFFLKFAKERGFDPLVAYNWYLQSRKDIMASSKVYSCSTLLLLFFVFFSSSKKSI